VARLRNELAAVSTAKADNADRPATPIMDQMMEARDDMDAKEKAAAKWSSEKRSIRKRVAAAAALRSAKRKEALAEARVHHADTKLDHARAAFSNLVGGPMSTPASAPKSAPKTRVVPMPEAAVQPTAVSSPVKRTQHTVRSVASKALSQVARDVKSWAAEHPGAPKVPAPQAAVPKRHAHAAGSKRKATGGVVASVLNTEFSKNLPRVVTVKKVASASTRAATTAGSTFAAEAAVGAIHPTKASSLSAVEHLKTEAHAAEKLLAASRPEARRLRSKNAETKAEAKTVRAIAVHGAATVKSSRSEEAQVDDIVDSELKKLGLDASASPLPRAPLAGPQRPHLFVVPAVAPGAAQKAVAPALPRNAAGQKATPPGAAKTVELDEIKRHSVEVVKKLPRVVLEKLAQAQIVRTAEAKIGV